MMYNPLNCAIILEVYQATAESGRPIPHTQTQLYTEMILWRLSRYLSEKRNPLDKKLPSTLEAISHYDSQLYQQLKGVGKLAYEGGVEGRVIFENLPEDFEDLGLLVKHTALYGRNETSTYNFFHLTMQEYMSAFYISQCPVDQQRTLLVKDGISNVVWRFVAGLTKMKDMGWDVFSEYVESVREHGCLNELVIQCLYESKNLEWLERKFGPNKVTFKNDRSISNYDAYALGYCISMSSSTWDITVSHSARFHSEMFVYGLKCGVSGGSINNFAFHNCEGIINGKEHLLAIPDRILQHIKSLSFRDCGINQTGFLNLAECLRIPSLHSLTSLDLKGYVFAAASVAVLLQALRDHRKLESLSLSGMDIDVDAANALVQLSLRELKIISPMAMVLHEPPAAEVYQKLGQSLLSSASLEKLTMCNFSCTVLDGIDDISDSISTLNLHFLPRIKLSRWSTADPRVKYGTKISHILRGNTSLKELYLTMELDKDEVCEILHSLEMNHTLENVVLLDENRSSYMNISISDIVRFHSSVVEDGTNFSTCLRGNTSLKELELRVPLDKDEVCDVLHSLEDNHTLEKLVVSLTSHYRSRCRFLKPVTTQLASEHLPAANPSRVKGGSRLGNFLRKNTSLKHLKLLFELDNDEVRDIVESMEDNHTLEVLELSEEYQYLYMCSSMSKEEPRISWIRR